MQARGDEEVAGRTVVLSIAVSGKEVVGACIENEDDRDPAMNGWIEVASLEVLKLKDDRP